MCWHKTPKMISQKASGSHHHVALGAAAVGHDHLRLQVRRNRRHDRAHLPDRRRDQDKIRAPNGAPGIRLHLVDHAKTPSSIEVAPRAPDPDDVLDRPCAPERKRKRRPDQPNADHDQLADFRLARHSFPFSFEFRVLSFELCRNAELRLICI